MPLLGNKNDTHAEKKNTRFTETYNVKANLSLDCKKPFLNS